MEGLSTAGMIIKCTAHYAIYLLFNWRNFALLKSQFDLMTVCRPGSPGLHGTLTDKYADIRPGTESPLPGRMA
ncbi:hypothetical protein BSPA111_04600 [Buttiauxella sp. A111]|nr:hypothetical protein BSPA111_04600 [Buttiauxella sp. A111]